MAITVLFFGQLVEMTGERQLTIPEAAGTGELRELLWTRFPALRDVVVNMAVDTVIINEDVALVPGSTVAMLPPFSGG